MGWIVYVQPRRGPEEIFAVGPNLKHGLKVIARQRRLSGCRYAARLSDDRWWTFWKRRKGRIR